MVLFVFVIVKFYGSLGEVVNRMEYNNLSSTMNYNVIPLESIRMQLENFSDGWARFNLFGNVVPFLPFGFLLPLAFRKMNTFWKVFGTGLATVFCIELFQFATKLGSFDVDDILLNMVGIVLGYIILNMTRNLLDKK